MTTQQNDLWLDEVETLFEQGKSAEACNLIESHIESEVRAASKATMEIARMHARMHGRHDLYDYADHWLISHEQQPYQPTDIQNLKALTQDKESKNE